MNMIIPFPVTKRTRRMPDPTDRALERLLAYPEGDGHNDLFVVDVMRRVRTERRTRKLVLYLFGGIGALFGLAGATMLSGSINALFTEAIPAMMMAQASLFVVGGIAFYLWFMNDDLALGGS